MVRVGCLVCLVFLAGCVEFPEFSAVAMDVEGDDASVDADAREVLDVLGDADDVRDAGDLDPDLADAPEEDSGDGSTDVTRDLVDPDLDGSDAPDDPHDTEVLDDADGDADGGEHRIVRLPDSLYEGPWLMGSMSGEAVFSWALFTPSRDRLRGTFQVIAVDSRRPFSRLFPCEGVGNFQIQLRGRELTMELPCERMQIQTFSFNIALRGMALEAPALWEVSLLREQFEDAEYFGYIYASGYCDAMNSSCPDPFGRQ